VPESRFRHGYDRSLLCKPRAKACACFSSAGARRGWRPRCAPGSPAVLLLPRIRRKNMPVSLTAPLQFLPTRVGQRFMSLQTPRLGSSGRAFAGIRVAGCSNHRLRESPRAPSIAQATTTHRRALARAGRARTRGRTRSSRSAIASGAAQPMTLRWYAPCSFNDGAPPGGASKCREEP
jgi:hypothetical protein